jgi:hypothetical protein
MGRVYRRRGAREQGGRGEGVRTGKGTEEKRKSDATEAGSAKSPGGATDSDQKFLAILLARTRRVTSAGPEEA